MSYFLQVASATWVVLSLAAMPRGAIASDKPISVKMEVAAKKLLAGDYCPYKVVIANNGVSTVTLSTSLDVQGLIIRMEHRIKAEKEKKGLDWKVMRIHSAQTEGYLEGETQLEGKRSFAKFGSAFRDGKGGLVFAAVGTHELRARVKCPIGEYVTEPIAISVEERSADQVTLIHNNSRILWIILDQLVPTEPGIELVSDLAKDLEGGLIRDSFARKVATDKFRESGMLGDRAVTHVAAFEELQRGLDSVRRDHLAITLAYDAKQKKQWMDVYQLIKELREESTSRRNLVHELGMAAKAGKFVHPEE